MNPPDPCSGLSVHSVHTAWDAISRLPTSNICNICLLTPMRKVWVLGLKLKAHEFNLKYFVVLLLVTIAKSGCFDHVIYWYNYAEKWWELQKWCCASMTHDSTASLAQCYRLSSGDLPFTQALQLWPRQCDLYAGTMFFLNEGWLIKRVYKKVLESIWNITKPTLPISDHLNSSLAWAT
jgi:hypothetical protein